MPPPRPQQTLNEALRRRLPDQRAPLDPTSGTLTAADLTYGWHSRASTSAGSSADHRRVPDPEGRLGPRTAADGSASSSSVTSIASEESETTDASGSLAHVSDSGSTEGHEQRSRSASEQNLPRSEDRENVAMQQEAGQARACRICFDSGNLSTKLISPCRCSGTMKYVHAGCLEEWRRLSPRSSSALRCDQCRAPYRFKKSRFVGFGTSPGLVLLVSMLLFGILAYGAGVICELAYSRFDSSVIEAKVEREQLDFDLIDTSHGVRFYVQGEGAGSVTSPRIMTYAQLLRHFRYGDPRQRTAKDAGGFLKFLYEFSADYDTEAAGLIAMAGAWTGVADPDYGKSDKELRKAQGKYNEQREVAAKQGWWSELKWVWLHGEDAPSTASTVSSTPPAPLSARETEPVASVPDRHAQAASSSSPIAARKWFPFLRRNAERPQLEDSVGDQRRATKLCPTKVQNDAASSRKGAQQGECITKELVKEKLMEDLSKQETWPIRVVTQMLLGLFVIGAGSVLQVMMSLPFTPFGNWGVGRHFARREARNRRGRNGGGGGAMDTVIIVLGVLLILFGILKAAYAVYKAVNSFSRRALGQVEDYLVDWTGEDEDAPRPHRIEQEGAPARAGPVLA